VICDLCEREMKTEECWCAARGPKGSFVRNEHAACLRICNDMQAKSDGWCIGARAMQAHEYAG
jgi:hypothetical protein